ncbi:MAG: MBOAT family protein [Deltaproteobacteria bacterium]|jgi:D-alanyl-lipoteichoic acid acyltransferase DltB (MBOAT superfamily)|nr:MBOAT family protein [Deltaproteobacteria bacterium]
MPFTSLEFAIFFGIVLTLNHGLRNNPKRYLPSLAIFNVVFYALGAPKFAPLLFVVAFVNWLACRSMGPERGKLANKIIIWACVAANLSILAFFKYFDFILVTLEDLGLRLHGGLFALPEIVYPAGLSFFTFQGMSLAIDKFRDPGMEKVSYVEALAFVSFFPTVLSGPIQRFEPFMEQAGNKAPSPVDHGLAVTLILSGLFKKVALSSYLSEEVVRDVFQMPDAFSFVGILGAVYGYGAQIYLDFSGYSDLAMGVGLLLGFDVGLNFKSPYLATNIRDFWRRWHVSLSTWLRDYLYFSLGGSRKGSTTLNLIVTQTLGGLWHGAHLRYLVWGLAHGILLAVTHAWFKVVKKKEALVEKTGFKSWKKTKGKRGRLKAFLGFFFTFHFVTFLWILFRADTMPQAWVIFKGIFDFSKPGEGSPLLAWIIVLLTLLGQWRGDRLKDAMTRFQRRLSVPLLSLWCAFWIIIIMRLGPRGILPFIYFQY